MIPAAEEKSYSLPFFLPFFLVFFKAKRAVWLVCFLLIQTRRKMERHSDHSADRVSQPGLKLLLTYWASHVGFERPRPLTSISLCAWIHCVVQLSSIVGVVL